MVRYRCFYSSFPNSCFSLLSSVFPLFIKSPRKADGSQPWQGLPRESPRTGPRADPRAAPATAEGGLRQQVAASPATGALAGQADIPTAFPRMTWEKQGKVLEVRVGLAAATLWGPEPRSASRARRSTRFCPASGD